MNRSTESGNSFSKVEGQQAESHNPKKVYPPCHFGQRAEFRVLDARDKSNDVNANCQTTRAATTSRFERVEILSDMDPLPKNPAA